MGLGFDTGTMLQVFWAFLWATGVRERTLPDSEWVSLFLGVKLGVVCQGFVKATQSQIGIKGSRRII